MANLYIAGLTGAAGGFLAGGYLGYHAERQLYWCSCDDPGLTGLLLGIFAGPALVTPFAVHAANGRRGSLTASYGHAALVAGLGFAGTIAMANSEAGLIPLFVTPLAQVLSAVGTETGTAEAP